VLKKDVQDWIKMVGQKMMHPKKVEKINYLKRLLKQEST